ncbi:unnamed protein product [Oikopleura dioica]|uniref:Peptidase S1 domain-containing protein n=1 Tax=Oikopleura dioica TaxID=34765 RepID=E4XYB0_OIKDI|nr:unnamed protein product [Oikopleura dioica]
MKDLFLLFLFSNAFSEKLYGLEIGSTGRVETEYATGNKNRFIVRISGHCQLRNGEYYQVKNVTGTWISDQHVITGRNAISSSYTEAACDRAILGARRSLSVEAFQREGGEKHLQLTSIGFVSDFSFIDKNDQFVLLKVNVFSPTLLKIPTFPRLSGNLRGSLEMRSFGMDPQGKTRTDKVKIMNFENDQNCKLASAAANTICLTNGIGCTEDPGAPIFDENENLVAIFYTMDARHPECKSNIVTKVEKLLSKNGKIENSFALSIDNELAQRVSQIINCPIPNPKTDNYLKKGRFIPLVTIATRLTDGEIRTTSLFKYRVEIQMKDFSTDYEITMVSRLGEFFSYDVVNVNREWILKRGRTALASAIGNCPFDSDLKWDVFG